MEKRDRDPRIFLAQSATHYKLGMNLRFSWPKTHSVKEHDTWVFLVQYQTEKHDRDPRVFLARSATHYKLGVNLRFSWPKTHSVKEHDTWVILAQYRRET